MCLNIIIHKIGFKCERTRLVRLRKGCLPLYSVAYTIICVVSLCGAAAPIVVVVVTVFLGKIESNLGARIAFTELFCQHYTNRSSFVYGFACVNESECVSVCVVVKISILFTRFVAYDAFNRFRHIIHTPTELNRHIQTSKQISSFTSSKEKGEAGERERTRGRERER